MNSATGSVPVSIDHVQALDALLRQALALEASDLHLICDHPPTCRVHGVLQAQEHGPLNPENISAMITPHCPPPLRAQFESSTDIDFSFQRSIDGVSHRFRANLFFSQQKLGACIRLIPEGIPSFEWAGFPEALAHKITQFRNGLVIVTGVTGSGKTTTLAMLINMVNQRGGTRIVTIEQPVEYLFPRCSDSIVTQREVGLDVATFYDGLKYGLRQDPDVILVGEIRDRETAQMALSAAETGHLVFSTMHTRDAKGAVTRYADLFPQAAQGDIRSQLAMSLRSVVSQHLLPSTEPGHKRELALEVMFGSLPVASAIRNNKIEALENCIVTGKAQGMITIDESLRLLVSAGRVSPEVAKRFANDPELFG